MTPTRLSTSPWLRAILPLPDPDPQSVRLQHVLEQLPAAAFLVAPRTGALWAINGRAAMLTEWARDELLARALAEVLAAPAASSALEQLYQLEAGSVRSLSAVPLRTRSGRTVVVDLRLSAFQDAQRGDTLVLVLASPIEERLSQEKEASQPSRTLNAVDQLLRLLAAPDETSFNLAVSLTREMISADAAGLYRVATDQPSMYLHYSDAPAKAFPPTLGPSEAQYLKTPMDWSTSQRPEGYLREAARAAGWAALITHPIGEPPAIFGAVVVAYRPGNAPPSQARPALALAARYIHHLMTHIVREASYLRSHDLAVRLSSQMAAINSQIDEGVVLLSREGTVDEINGAAARMLGYRSEDVTGLPCEDLLVAEGTLADAIRENLQQPDAEQPVECRLLRRSGESFPVSISLRHLPEGGCVLTLRDLSDLRASEVNQEHLDQLIYVGQATQTFAHQLRSQLNNIAVGVQYLAARLPRDESVQQALGKMQTECGRLSELMNDMLTWAKPVDPDLQPTDLDSLLTRLLNRWSAKISRRNVRLNYWAHDDCPPVLADARLIEQVFVNLVDNALQAMAAGGLLSITLRPVDRGAHGHVVEARVADSGPGIPEETRRRMFDPYFTTRPDGTGLGLAICKRFVTIHRGAISAESFPTTGTVITVSLPAHDPGGHHLSVEVPE